VDLSFDRLRRRDPGRAGKTGQRQLDAAPDGVKGLHYELAFFTFAQDVARRTRGLVPHSRQRQVAPRPVDGDKGTMGGEFFDRTFYLGAELVRGNEADETQRLVERLGRQLAPPAPAPAFAPGFFGLDRLFDGDGDSALQLSFPATASRPFRRQFEPAFFGLPGRFGPLLALRFLHGFPAPRAAHGSSRGENPPHPRHRFASDQAVLVEEPFVLAVELLERVVGKHYRPHLVRDPEKEGVASADRSRRRGHDVALGLSLFEYRALLDRDPVPKCGVYNDGDNVVRVLDQKFTYRLVELLEAGQ
jgi:hypothetical protein